MLFEGIKRDTNAPALQRSEAGVCIAQVLAKPSLESGVWCVLELISAGRESWKAQWEFESPGLTRELSFNNKEILPARRLSMEALVDGKVLILQGEQLISLHIGEN